MTVWTPHPFHVFWIAFALSVIVVASASGTDTWLVHIGNVLVILLNAGCEAIRYNRWKATGDCPS